MYTSCNYYPKKCGFPTHIALIPDGGRRWAKLHNCTIREAYDFSMKKIKQLIEWAFSEGTSCFSIYMASTYNFNRSETEIRAFCESEWDFIYNDFFTYAIEKCIRIKVVGKKDENIIPYIPLIDKIERKTADGDKIVYFCFNYNSFDEIETAFSRITIEKEFFANRLDIICPVNLLIRTGGANVLSGFLLPQVAFARLFFLDVLFNDLSLEDFQKCISKYIGYELKYGE